MTALDVVVDEVKDLRESALARDAAMERVRKVRSGESRLLFGDLFPEKFPEPMAANFIDVAARTFAEAIAPLPNLACSSGAMRTDRDKQRATKKNRIGKNYWDRSNLDSQMFNAADQFNSYAFIPFVVEPDFKRKTPVIIAKNPLGCYYRIDRFGNVLVFVETWKMRASKIAALYPEFASRIVKKDMYGQQNGAALLELVKHTDADGVTLYLPDRDNLVLSTYPLLTECVPVAIAQRPSLDPDTLRGQFDDVLYAQLARSLMVTYTLAAAEKSVNSPIAMPKDIVQLNIGPDAVIQTDNPQSVRRVPLDVPPAAFAATQELNQELRTGARFTNAVDGSIDASIITGKGVEALLGAYSTQIQAAQTVLGLALSRATSLCFEMDEARWPNLQKKINGVVAGETFRITYSPKRDIDGDYTCDVSYGFLSGLNASQAVVLMLQLLQSGDISHDTLRRQLPWQMDVDGEQRKIDEERADQALTQAVLGLAAAVPMLAQAGGDPSDAVRKVAQFVKGRQSGKSPVDLVGELFPEAPANPQGESVGGPEQAPPSEDTPGPVPAAPSGPPPGVGQTIAGIRNGRPMLSSQVMRQG